MIYKLLFSTTILNAFGFGLGFIVQLLLARLLSVEDYGYFNFFFALNMTLSIIALLGFPQAIMRIVNKDTDRNVTYSLWIFSTIITLALGCVCGALIYAALYLLALPYGATPSVFILSLCFLIPVIILRLQSAFFRALEKPLTSVLYEIVWREICVLFGIGVIFWLWSPLNINLILELYNIAFAILAIVSILHFRKVLYHKGESPISIMRQQSKNWLIIAAPMMITVFAQMLMHRTDILMIGVMIGPYETGLYGVAAKLAQIVAFPVMAMGAVFSPLAAKYFQQGDVPALRKLFRQTQIFIGGATSILVGGLILALPLILSFFGHEYEAATNAAIILLIGNMLNVFWGPIVYTMIMCDQEKYTMNVSLMFTGLNLALNFALINWIGIEGAAISTILCLHLKNAVLSHKCYSLKLLKSN